MYKLFVDLNDGSNLVFYQNSKIPHLWLLATKGQRKVSFEQFTDSLIHIASLVGDDIFTDEIANMIAHLSASEVDYIQISGPSCNYEIEDLKKQVEAYDFEAIFGTKTDKIEYYVTAESEEYFKEHRKNYRAQYRNVTNIIIGINVVVFVINYLVGYTPLQFIVGGSSLLNIFTWISIVFAGFTQLSIMHIFFNMWFLLSIGPVLERILGKSRFIGLYTFGLMFSGAAVALFSQSYTAGASGALYALFSFFICLTLKHETNQAQVRNVLSTFGINILFTLLTPGISIAGHLGGAVAGVIVFLIYNRK